MPWYSFGMLRYSFLLNHMYSTVLEFFILWISGQALLCCGGCCSVDSGSPCSAAGEGLQMTEGEPARAGATQHCKLLLWNQKTFVDMGGHSSQHISIHVPRDVSSHIWEPKLRLRLPEHCYDTAGVLYSTVMCKVDVVHNGSLPCQHSYHSTIHSPHSTSLLATQCHRLRCWRCRVLCGA